MRGAVAQVPAAGPAQSLGHGLAYSKGRIAARQGVDTRGPTYHSTNAAGWRNDQWDMTVNPRTGQSWTAAELNAGTEFGFQIYSTPGAWNYITQAWVEVTYRVASDSTVYIGGVYEKKGDGGVTKYYQAYGRAVAMREPSGPSGVPPAGGAGTNSLASKDGSLDAEASRMSTDQQALSPTEFFILALLPDHCAPLSIVLPEVLPLTSANIAEFFHALRRLAALHMISMWAEEPSGHQRTSTADDYTAIEAEYETGSRDAHTVRQIFDRDDLWLQITDSGRHKLFSDPRAKDAQPRS